MQAFQINLVISVLCALLIVVHLIWPNLSIDTITLSLLVVGIIPWMIKYLKSVELPGGIKFELNDAKRATKRILNSTKDLKAKVRLGITTSLPAGDLQGLLQIKMMYESDPKMALAAFRIELEKRVRELGQSKGMPGYDLSVEKLVARLTKEKILPLEMAEGLQELLKVGNEVVHGGEVSKEASDWIMNNLGNIIDAIAALGNAREAEEP